MVLQKVKQVINPNIIYSLPHTISTNVSMLPYLFLQVNMDNFLWRFTNSLLHLTSSLSTLAALHSPIIDRQPYLIKKK